MTIDNRSREQLLAENEALRFRLEEAEQTLQALGSGTVDALVVTMPGGEQVFTLQGAEHPYRILVETMHEGAATLAADGTLLYCNSSLAAMLELPLEQLIGASLGSYVAASDYSIFAAHLDNCILKSDKQEITLITGSGRPITVLFSCCAVELSGKRGMSMVFTDITERKRAEMALISSEQEFRLIAEAMPQIVWTTRPDGWNTYFNQRWVDYTGLTLEESYGHGWNKPFHPDDRQRAWDAWQNAVTNNGIYSLECRLRRADGIYRWWLIRGAPALDQEGKTLKWLGTCTDIDDIKQAAAQLQIAAERERAAAAFRDSEERLRFALETIHTGVWDLNLVDHTAYRSLEHDRIFGYSELLPIWTYELFLEHVLPEDRAVMDASFQKAVATQGEWHFECRIRRADGKIRTILAAGRHRIKNGNNDLRMAGIVQDITERKQMEHKLVETQQWLQAIMEAVPVGISFSEDSSCQSITGNPAVLAQFEIKPSDNLSASAPEDSAPGRLLRFWCQGIEINATQLPLQRAVAERRLGEPMELAIENPSGRRWFAEASGAPLFNQQGEVIGGVAVTVDITERKRMEESLRESEERLRLVLEASAMGTFEINLETGEARWNDVEFELLGLKPGDIPSSSENFFRYVHPDDIGFVKAQWEMALRSGELDIEFRIVRADRRERWLAGKGRFVVEAGSSGRAVRFQGVNFDIPKRKRAEEKLRESEERYRNMMESAHDWVWETDAADLYTFSNYQVQEILGYGPEEIIGKRPFDLMSEDEADRVANLFAEIKEQRLPFHNLINVNRHKDGSAVILETNGAPFFNSQGGFMGYRGMDRDITVQKQLEASLQQYSEMLESRVEQRTAELREKDKLLFQQSRLAAMGEMINNIAHQWRQPLNVLALNIQRLPLFYDMGKLTKAFLDTSTQDAMTLIQHMSQTIDDFRNFFQPDKEKTDFSVNRLIGQTINLVSDSFKQHQIKLVAQTEGEDWINGYPNEFSQVIMNILQNARDVLVERNITDGLVTISSSTENGKTVIIISDNAGGIPEAIIDQVFDPYFSTKGVQGTGIGLYMSKSIIETNMGGKITVRNVSQGAEFRIEV